MASPEPTRGSAPPGAKRINGLAVTSFLLALAALGAGLFSLGWLNTALSTPGGYFVPAPDYSTPWRVYWPSLVTLFVAFVLGGAARSLAKQRQHEKPLAGLALAGMLLGAAGTVTLVCGGVFYSVLIALQGIH